MKRGKRSLRHVVLLFIRYRNREPWYNTQLSYNPAIHRIKQALFHGAIVEDLNKQPLGPPHPEILKYFEPPRKVVKRARHAIEAVREAFNVKEGMSLHTTDSRLLLTHFSAVPKTVPRNRKDGHVRARDDGDDALLLDKRPDKRIKLSETQTQATQRRVFGGTQRKPVQVSDDSETEPEDEQDLILNQKSRDTTASKDVRLLTPERSLTLDPDRAPGRIIGSAYPLEDFKKNIAEGDLVSKAVEDLAFVIISVISKPFSSKRTDEMIDCIKAMRKVALEVCLSSVKLPTISH
jgi:ATP-dependent DNA helicase 2 subunit 2